MRVHARPECDVERDPGRDKEQCGVDGARTPQRRRHALDPALVRGHVVVSIAFEVGDRLDGFVCAAGKRAPDSFRFIMSGCTQRTAPGRSIECRAGESCRLARKRAPMDVWSTDSDLQTYASVPADPRAVVLLLHGLGEHAGRHAADRACVRAARYCCVRLRPPRSRKLARTARDGVAFRSTRR